MIFSAIFAHLVDCFNRTDLNQAFKVTYQEPPNLGLPECVRVICACIMGTDHPKHGFVKFIESFHAVPRLCGSAYVNLSEIRVIEIYLFDCAFILRHLFE